MPALPERLRYTKKSPDGAALLLLQASRVICHHLGFAPGDPDTLKVSIGDSATPQFVNVSVFEPVTG